MQPDKIALGGSKAGRRFMGLMRVFNAGDMDALRAFITAYTTDESLEQNPLDQWQSSLENIYAATGGMRVFQVLGTDDYQVALLMQAKNNAALYVVTLAVSDEYPHKIAEFTQRPA